ncbi:asparagine synthetase B family protein [Aurantiacibacter xanthus]|uniref:asparagine synthase (glutamine-hydrolyzing) n=1 Tax=Aurantiacibacter xanthus TaxID=1784712 RepID=A0A3A1PFZ4_9SPHN|nr:asparagine synthetase B family protein [Aurantiacibacter xanthus]RIV92738.1 asparagine synthetase B family protein [Aurantiacibacter xanthus]
MSRRYAALIDAPASVIEEAIAKGAEQGMSCVCQLPWLTLIADRDLQMTRLKATPGVIVGELFRRSGEDGRSTAQRIAVLNDLPDACWGAYIVFAHSPEGISVLRGASGPNPCYFTQLEEGWGFASDAALLSQMTERNFAVDWQALGALLLYRESRPEQTCLAEVRELLPGTMAVISTDRVGIQTIWSPEPYITAPIGAFKTASDRLHDAILRGVTAWAKRFERPLLELSGGLDSSIVAAALAEAGSRFHCLSYRASGADLDETDYARRVAEHLGMSFEVVFPDSSAVRLEVSAAAHLPRPHARSFIQETDRLSWDAARRIGADAFFTGNGGDNVFCFLSSVAPVRDRLRSRNPFASWKTAADIAQVCEVGRWEVLIKSIRGSFQRSAHSEWHWTPDFLSADVVTDTARPLPHPWLAACDRSAPGSCAHVAAILRIQNYLEGHARLAHAPLIAPLLSQPIIETCLAIPSWHWCAGGRNRAVARAAFADDLPKDILGRQGKGSFAGMISRILESRKDQVRAMLLDGLLSENGLLDRALIDQQLRPESPVSSRSAGRILGLVDAEVWARSWVG